ncbi:MAG: NAD(P)/FAD-dependent oxidoreductase, partial [Magnetospiraceae bacterium]
MVHVVIIGAGVGGMPMAYELREALRKEDKITVIGNGPDFQFTPSNPWVLVGWRKRKDICLPVADFLKKKDIDFIPKPAKQLKPDENKLELVDGTVLDYDYCIIATGPKLAFDEVPGLGPSGFTKSVCTTDHAEAAFDDWEAFCKDPGPIVVGAVQGASCYGPAYEMAMIMDTDLRRRKIRDKVPMTYVSPEPYVGHLGLGGVGDSKGILESEMRDKHIKWIT